MPSRHVIGQHALNALIVAFEGVVWLAELLEARRVRKHAR